MIPQFITIEFPADNNFADSLSILPYSLEIEEVGIHPAFATNQIAIRENTHQIRYFVNHQWAVRLQQSLTQYITDYYMTNQLFDDVGNRFWKDPADYKVSTYVHNLEVKQIDKDFSAYMHIDFFLIDVDNNQVVTKHTVKKNRLLPKRNLNLFAEAVNNMFFEELHFFAQKGWFELAQQ